MSRAGNRWTAFLQQITERHRLIAQDAMIAARELLVESGFDPRPLGTAMSATQTRLVELEARIIDTWNAQVEATFESEGIPRDAQTVERARGEDLAWNLENE